MCFPVRGQGYLVSPRFSERKEWQTLLQTPSVWEELLIRPHIFSKQEKSKKDKSNNIPRNQSKCSSASIKTEETKAKEEAVKRICCRVCKLNAKERCIHFSCKLCCEKLRKVAKQRTGENKEKSIYVGGRGRVLIADLNIVIHAYCPVHRRHNEDINNNNFSSEIEKEEKCIKSNFLGPFKSLSLFPCGISFVTNETGEKPFFAMKERELGAWCCHDEERRRSCIHPETGKNGFLTVLPRGPSNEPYKGAPYFVHFLGIL